MRIAIDFDGTIVEHTYPYLGAPVPGAIEYMKQFQEAGALLILWTMRSGIELHDAIEYCADNGIVFNGINEGVYDREWTTSPKAYANIYIDDAAFGCPLIQKDDMRPYVDWSVVGPAVLGQLNGTL